MKHLKGLLIYANKGSNSDSDEAIQKASLKMAIGYKHNFVSMTKEADTFIGGKRLHSVLNRNHGGYHGEELLKVLRSAYMETRYPTSIPVAKSFPAGKHIYHDPLSSSGLSDFVRIMCGTITQHLIDKLDVKKVYNNVSQQYSHLESFSRFKNIYMPALWPDESK